MADATSSAISPTVQSTSNYAPATSNGQNAYDLQRQQVQSQAEQQKAAQQAALKRRLAAQGLSDSGVNVAAANTVDQNVASTEGAALSSIDTQQLAAAQAADTAAQQYAYNTGLQSQSIAGNLANTTLQGSNQMNVQGLVNTGSLQDIGAQGTNQIQAINAQGQVQSGLNLQQYGFTTQEASAAATYAQQLQAQVTAGQLSIASANAEYQQQLASMQAGFTSSQIGQQGVIQASAAAAQYGYNTGLQAQQGQINQSQASANAAYAQQLQAQVTAGQMTLASANAAYAQQLQAQVTAGQMTLASANATYAQQLQAQAGQIAASASSQAYLQNVSLADVNSTNTISQIAAQGNTQISVASAAAQTQELQAAETQQATSLFQAASIPGANPTAAQAAMIAQNPIYADAWQAGQSGIPYTQYQTQLKNDQTFQAAAITQLDPKSATYQDALKGIISNTGGFSSNTSPVTINADGSTKQISSPQAQTGAGGLVGAGNTSGLPANVTAPQSITNTSEWKNGQVTYNPTSKLYTYQGDEMSGGMVVDQQGNQFTTDGNGNYYKTNPYGKGYVKVTMTVNADGSVTLD